MKLSYPEGATPIDDISDLKIPWLRTMEDLNRVEAENIAKATKKYLLKSVTPPKNWFNIATLKRIHKEMFGDVWSWAGSFRTSKIIPGVESYQILPCLNDLCEDVLFWCTSSSDLTFLEQAARIHHRLVWIHPFPNGNGRFSRLIADRYLKASRCSFPKWPTGMQKDCSSRKRYIKALQRADNGDYSPLINYMKEFSKNPDLKCKKL